nr:MAG TPA: hypothetical protein [Caudoviricetes sp.]
MSLPLLDHQEVAKPQWQTLWPKTASQLLYHSQRAQ